MYRTCRAGSTFPQVTWSLKWKKANTPRRSDKYLQRGKDVLLEGTEAVAADVECVQMLKDGEVFLACSRQVGSQAHMSVRARAQEKYCGTR
jgi:hypothetical protein